jgi:hypothetical protein
MSQILYTTWMESHGYLLIAGHPYVSAMVTAFVGGVVLAIGVSIGIRAWGDPGASKLHSGESGRSRFSLRQAVAGGIRNERTSR